MTSAEISAQTVCQVKHTKPNNTLQNCFCIVPSRGKTETERQDRDRARSAPLCLCLISLSVRSVSHRCESPIHLRRRQIGTLVTGGEGCLLPFSNPLDHHPHDRFKIRTDQKDLG